MNSEFTWTDYYQELASKVLSFKADRSNLLKLVEKSYQDAGLDYKLYWDNHYFADLDPFTFFGTFNKGIADKTRIELLRAYKQNFEISAELPSEFAGIPVLNNMRAWFMADQQGEQMETYWDLFEVAIKYADGDMSLEERIADLFDKAVSFPGTGWNLTMALYWIRPFAFINLDNVNREKMKENSLFDGHFPTGKEYVAFCKELHSKINTEDFPYSSFPEFSYQAWSSSQQKKKDAQNSSSDMILGDREIEKTRYWLYSPGNNADKWDEFYNSGIMAIEWDEIGDLSLYENKEDMKQAMKKAYDPSRSYKMAAHATWQFANDMKVGDVVFVKKGMRLIVGRGVVDSEYTYDEERKTFKNVRKVRWTHSGEWPHPGQAAMKTLTDITAYTEYVEQLKALFDSEDVDDAEENDIEYPVYDSEMFLNEVYMDRQQYDTLVALIQSKRNVILQGAPGVGKTFAAKRLAYSMMGVMDSRRVMMVQFHQSYSYEDFIMGFRPTENGFKLKRGAFYDFCKAAEIDSDNDYFFIIDEINRGNLSKIFGELFMLIENDKRGVELKLLYADEKFSVPKNVYIIGMMNTADRSLAMMDYALRRRFAFFEMNPGFNTNGFKEYKTGLNNAKFDSLISCVERLNEVIAADESLGEGFCIGHSYFCNLKEVTDQALSGIVEFELIPLLKEYWFDEPVKAKDWINNLRSSIK